MIYNILKQGNLKTKLYNLLIIINNDKKYNAIIFINFILFIMSIFIQSKLLLNINIFVFILTVFKYISYYIVIKKNITINLKYKTSLYIIRYLYYYNDDSKLACYVELYHDKNFYYQCKADFYNIKDMYENIKCLYTTDFVYIYNLLFNNLRTDIIYYTNTDDRKDFNIFLKKQHRIKKLKSIS